MKKNGATYTANSSEAIKRYDYVIRENAICNSTVFTDSDYKGNLTKIAKDSNSFKPTTQQVTDFNDKYICFNVLLEDGEQTQAGLQLNFSPSTDDSHDDTVSSGTSKCDQSNILENWDENQQIALDPSVLTLTSKCLDEYLGSLTEWSEIDNCSSLLPPRSA